jgi:predicted alpha/beta superfamily hydrolase
LTGGVTGTVRYHRHLEFDGLSPRDLIVWLPADYKTSGQPYPVLYMHDGQNLIDPRTSSFGEDWQVDETCTRLIAEKRMRPLIVVGIYNTADRTKEYVSGETGDRYVRFVIETVKPLIDATYRTKSDRVATAVGGSSAGGLCAFRMAWEHPQVFSKAICMSPAFQYQRPDGSFSVDYRAAFDESKTPEPMPFFYLDNGGVGLEKLLQPGIDQMLAALQSRKLVEEQNFVWKLYPDSRHDESGWAERLPTALQRLFPVESGSELSGEE